MDFVWQDMAGSIPAAVKISSFSLTLCSDPSWLCSAVSVRTHSPVGGTWLEGCSWYSAWRNTVDSFKEEDHSIPLNTLLKSSHIFKLITLKMHIHIYMLHIYVHTYVHTFIWIYTHACLHEYVHAHTHAHTHMHLYKHTRTYYSVEINKVNLFAENKMFKPTHFCV